VQLLRDILTHDEIQSLRDYWNRYNELSYVNCWTYPGHAYRDRSEYIDRRLVIVNDSDQGRIMKRIVDDIWPGQNLSFWANFQRQAVCHQLHVDEYGTDRVNPTWTIIIALDTVPEWKAVIFKEMFNGNSKLNDFVAKIDYRSPPKGDYSKLHDLDHMDKWVDGVNYNFCNWFEIDGVFCYEAGCGVLFDTNQAHTTNNWPKYPKFTHRDLIQIHIGGSTATSSTFHDVEKGGESIPDATAMREKMQQLNSD